ncbi:2-aminoethanethiol dioxygenase-like [Lineus longissimus]|uniref:2-aminoethanethiol dioxygenase-like n=1 Tax=Lineus longissimus TaxID=88925 RepID=UPI00315D71F7
MATIQKVARLAYQTFSKSAPDKAFLDNFNRLKRMIRHVTAADIDFNQELVKSNELFKPEGGKAPVTYIGLWEDDCFSMGVFVLKNGVTLPMHDHPGMHGLCKIISGTVDVKRYTALVSNNVAIPSELAEKYTNWKKYLQPARRTPVTRINAETDLDACCLSPIEENFHEIQAINGPAAFLDILAPPYNSTEINVCHYFKDVTPKSSDTGQSESCVPAVSWLLRVPQPLDFWCDTHPYTGPPLNPLALSEEKHGDQDVT